MNVLVIAAHPDDEILGMGGTLKKLSRKNKITILIMATGIFARRESNYKNSTKYHSEDSTIKEMEQQTINLKKDAKKALKVVGVKNIEFLDFPDNEMDTISTLEVTKSIEKHIDLCNPDTVFTHSIHDVNIDHRIIYNATITATRPSINNNVKQVISFEVPSSSEWNFPSMFIPNIFVDISAELKFKLKAMSMYKNELMEYPHPRSLDALEIISKRWGTVSGFQAAEAFSLVRKIVEEFT